MATNAHTIGQTGRIEPEELAAVIGLLQRCGLPTGDVHADLLRHFIGARQGAVLAGTIAVQPLDAIGLLRSLAVAPEARGHGIGARLCLEAESLARAGGLRTLYLLTSDASRFFEARGYVSCAREAVPEEVRQTEQFRSLCPASAAVMRKDMPPAPGTEP